jgi:hypothetical protein
MTKQDFEILMNSLYSNNQLFIPQGQNIKEWIDNAFVDKQEEAINYTRCCESDSEQLCDEGNLGKIKKLYTKVGDEWVEYKTE